MPTLTSGSIKDGEVKTADLANDAVTSAKIADGTIQEEDIADGVIPDGGGTINLNVHQVKGEPGEVGAQTTNTVTADCPDGEILTGGGFVANYPIHVLLSAQHPNGDNAWAVTGFNEASSPEGIQAFAYCLDPTIP